MSTNNQLDPAPYLIGHHLGRDGAEPIPRTERRHRFGYTEVDVASCLIGNPWDDLALGILHGLSPTRIRVCPPGHGTQCDAQTGRITVYLDNDNLIDTVRQEIEIMLPADIQHGHHADLILRGKVKRQDPYQTPGAICNVEGLKRVKFT